MPLDSRTRATLRSAEFGFFGVMILTCKQTPFFCGHPCMAGCLGLLRCGTRGFRTSWLIVGMDRGRSISFFGSVVVSHRGMVVRCVKLDVGRHLVKGEAKNS